MMIPPVKIYFPDEDRKQILTAIDECLRTGQLTLGKYVKAFEDKFAKMVGTRYAIAVNSGTSSIEIPLRIFGVKGKEVIVPTNTFFATPGAVLHAGGRVRFVDADPQTFSIDVESLREAIGPETVGVIVVHIAGIVTPRMTEIQEICKEHGLWLLEDAAHAHGASYYGRMAGAFGRAASFSFFPTKVITSAEGGVIATNDVKVYEEALIYRDQGKAESSSNFHTRLGYNWRMSEPHAIIGISQLARLQEFTVARSRIAGIYDRGLKDIPGVQAFRLPEGCLSNYYKYIALLEKGVDRSLLKKQLRERYQVGLSGEVYDVPCHQQPIFRPYSAGEFPNAEDICRRHICLPIYSNMTDNEAEYVLFALKSALVEIPTQRNRTASVA
ncbi:MAG: aminotransferase DegT [Verrucomicrobia bacterium]|nr:MAG: aminotransferase DegT [Verrucomicrobiota bacterium]